jgi:hypothetical protein
MSLRPALVALCATAALVAAERRCLDQYHCVFQRAINGVAYGWDFHTLCKDGPYQTDPVSAVGTPGSDYVWTNYDGQNYTFNICGNSSAVCSWDPNEPEYQSRGVVVQVRGQVARSAGPSSGAAR